MVINLSEQDQKNKEIGLYIRKARKASGVSIKECGEALGIDRKQIEAFEKGETIPSVPVLESFSFYFDVPLEYFLTGDSNLFTKKDKVEQNLKRFILLRRRLIGALIRKSREENGLSIQDLAMKTSLAEQKIKEYEFGECEIPYFDLETIATALNMSIDDFRDQNGPIRDWLDQQKMIDDFQKLPPELQTFIVKPINTPYLELAQKLSGMPVDKLRDFAEALLEITL